MDTKATDGKYQREINYLFMFFNSYIHKLIESSYIYIENNAENTSFNLRTGILCVNEKMKKKK